MSESPFERHSGSSARLTADRDEQERASEAIAGGGEARFVCTYCGMRISGPEDPADAPVSVALMRGGRWDGDGKLWRMPACERDGCPDPAPATWTRAEIRASESP